MIVLFVYFIYVPIDFFTLQSLAVKKIVWSSEIKFLFFKPNKKVKSAPIIILLTVKNQAS
jgi:hypothetical protein